MESMDEAEARRLASLAVERAGGGRMVVGSPRHPYSPHASQVEEVEGQTVMIHYGEASSPAIAIVAGWVFEIRENELVLLDRPRRGPSSG